MRVLFISNHSQLSGWSTQACNHILALDSVGVDVYPKNINIINNQNPDLHPRIKELEKKSCRKPDIIVQNVLPHMLEYTSGAKCVSYCVMETTNFRNTNWTSRLNLMDVIFTSCYSNKQAYLESGVTKPVAIIPECIDTSRYSKGYPEHPISLQLAGKFIFLAVGEFTQRKNIEAILRAFHTEFSPSEPVELVIKTTPVGMSNPQADINSRLEAVKKGLKLYNDIGRYKRENVICGFLSEDDMISLHQSVDCFVSASHGEAFCIPAAISMACGKVCIVPNYGGFQQYCSERNSFLVSGVEDYCYQCNDTLPDLYTAGEKYFYPSIDSLRQQMRNAFSKRGLSLQKQQQAKKDIEAFNIENVGKLYKKELERLMA